MWARNREYGGTAVGTSLPLRGGGLYAVMLQIRSTGLHVGTSVSATREFRLQTMFGIFVANMTDIHTIREEELHPL